jgi:DNA-binding NtrC family response regulator
MKFETLFIVYKDDFWARSIVPFFHGRGYRVETAKAVSDMIRKVRNGNIHVILIDDEIEGVKAIDLVNVIKKINSKTQIIVTSSENSIGLAKQLREAGIFYQAMKPVDLEEIKSVVECAFKKVERKIWKRVFSLSLFQKGFQYEFEQSPESIWHLIQNNKEDKMNSLLDLLTFTKGVEYIIAIVFLFSFIAFWRLLFQR